MWENTCNVWKTLKSARSGNRFQKVYHCRKDAPGRRAFWGRIAMITFGCFLILFGAAIGWLPGPGGFLAFVGMAIVAQYFLWMAKTLDFCERKLIAAWHSCRAYFASSPAGEKQNSQSPT